MKPFCLFALLLCLCPIAVYAQTAEVGGAVRDPSGAVIPNASLEFRNQDTVFDAKPIRMLKGFTISRGWLRVSTISRSKQPASRQPRATESYFKSNSAFNSMSLFRLAELTKPSPFKMFRH